MDTTSVKNCVDTCILDAIEEVFVHFPNSAATRARVYRLIAQGFDEIASDLERQYG